MRFQQIQSQPKNDSQLPDVKLPKAEPSPTIAKLETSAAEFYAKEQDRLSAAADLLRGPNPSSNYPKLEQLLSRMESSARTSFDIPAERTGAIRVHSVRENEGSIKFHVMQSPGYNYGSFNASADGKTVQLLGEIKNPRYWSEHNALIAGLDKKLDISVLSDLPPTDRRSDGSTTPREQLTDKHLNAERSLNKQLTQLLGKTAITETNYVRHSESGERGIKFDLRTVDGDGVVDKRGSVYFKLEPGGTSAAHISVTGMVDIKAK